MHIRCMKYIIDDYRRKCKIYDGGCFCIIFNCEQKREGRFGNKGENPKKT